MSPILVRPVREQLEHDRVIRLLTVRLQRRGDVVANIGESQTVFVRVGQVQVFPDLVVTTADKTHKVLETVEVETAESVNHLEAMAQWAHLGRGRAPFHLYVPAGSVEIARRLAAENHVNVAELWSFHTAGDQTRFTMVHQSPAELKRAAAELRRATAKHLAESEAGLEVVLEVKAEPAVAPEAPQPQPEPPAASPPVEEHRPAATKPVARAKPKAAVVAKKAAPAAKSTSKPSPKPVRAGAKAARSHKGK